MAPSHWIWRALSAEVFAHTGRSTLEAVKEVDSLEFENFEGSLKGEGHYVMSCLFPIGREL